MYQGTRTLLELFRILVSRSQYRCGNQKTRNLEMTLDVSGFWFPLRTRVVWGLCFPCCETSIHSQSARRVRPTVGHPN